MSYLAKNKAPSWFMIVSVSLLLLKMSSAGMVMPLTVIIVAVFQVVLAARARVNRWTT
jgi:hypothetical protein